MAQPEVTFREVFEDSDDEPDIAYYPAIHNKKVGRPPGSGKNQKRPYEKKGESSKITEPVTIYKAPGFDKVDELEEEDTQDVRMSESPSRENAAKKYRRSRKDPNYNAWEDIKTRTVQMTFEQAAELNPTVKQQIRNGLSEIKREYKVVEINSAQSRLQEDESSSEEEEDTRKTSAYAIGTIENVPVEYIIDTEAGRCMMSNEMRQRLGWGIDCPTNQTFTTANGAKAVPLGKLLEVPVRFGEVTIPVDMIVVQTTTYEVILGNEWLKKAHATVDLNAEKMKITHRGKSFLIPLNIDKGIRPKFEEVKEQEDDGAFVAVNEPEIEEPEETIEEVIQANDQEEGNPWLQEVLDEREDLGIITRSLRLLTQEERSKAYEWMLQDGRCAFCQTRVYAAEMSCDCPWTMRIKKPLEEVWKENQPKSKKNSYRRESYQKKPQQEDIIYDINQWKKGPRSELHPFRKEDPRIWDQFWTEVPYVGRNQFRQE